MCTINLTNKQLPSDNLTLIKLSLSSNSKIDTSRAQSKRMLKRKPNLKWQKSREKLNKQRHRNQLKVFIRANSAKILLYSNQFWTSPAKWIQDLSQDKKSNRNIKHHSFQKEQQNTERLRKDAKLWKQKESKVWESQLMKNYTTKHLIWPKSLVSQVLKMTHTLRQDKLISGH